MDIDDFRSILESSGVDVWTFIDTAILVASIDFGNELKQKRDKIVEMLYASSSDRCRNCDVDLGRISNGHDVKKSDHLDSKEGTRGGGGGGGSVSPAATPVSIHGDDDVGVDVDDELDPYAGLFDDEQKKILEIKQHLEDPDQSEDSLVDLLQSLADMDITFKALKETDIGRHVNQLRKHSSNDVRRLVKHLVRKWKYIVDEWVKSNPQGEHASSALMADGDSPQQKFPQNGYHQVPDFAYSPNPHNGSSGSDKNNSGPERKPKPVPPKEAPPRPAQQPAVSASVSHSVQRQREPPRENNFDADRLASASKRLQANYKEAENAKKQRTIQVMDIHELPKPKNKNTFFAKNKGGGGGSHGRHW